MTDEIQIENMLSNVDLNGSAKSVGPDFTAAQRREIERASASAYHASRANGNDVDTAKRAAVEAAITLAERWTCECGELITHPDAERCAECRSKLTAADTDPAPAIVLNSTEPPANDAESLIAYLGDLPARAADYESARAAVNALPLPPELPTHESHEGSIAAGVDAVGLARSERDRAAAIAAGFTPAETVYTRGLRVIKAGVEAARRSREEYDAKPLVSQLCADFVARIVGERREDIVVPAASIRMEPSGAIRAGGHFDAAAALFSGTLEADAFPALCSRMGFGSGARYLRDRCRPELRAYNVNEQAITLEASEAKLATAERDAAKREGRAAEAVSSLVSLRTRDAARGSAARSVYAVTSPTYAPFDADKVAEAIARSTPADARGSVAYDGRRSRFEILFHSNVQPRHYVAGEFFKAGVVVTTDDTGAGGIRARAVVWQNLCLNLAIIDEASKSLLHLIHVGNVSELARKFARGYADALKTLEHFLTVWGYACEEDVTVGARRVSDGSVPEKPREIVEGIFAGLIAGGERARVKLPRARGQKMTEIVEQLVECWERDESGARSVHATSRAAIVNAITRWAHEVVDRADDPWAEDEISRRACALLWTPRGAKSPKALEWIDPATLATQAETEATDDAPAAIGALS